MIKHIWLYPYLLAFERGYRPFMLGVRTAVSLLLVVFLYLIFKSSAVIWMGLCTLSLCQACIRTPLWRFEVNILMAYAVSSVAILCAYPFTYSYTLICVYSAFLAFIMFLGLYYKFGEGHLLFTLTLPQYSVFSLKSFSDALLAVGMNTCALVITLFVCAFLIRPNLRRELSYETRALLREFFFYMGSAQAYILSRKSGSLPYKSITRRRREIATRLQNLQLILSEISLHSGREGAQDKHGRLQRHSIFARLIERFVEGNFAVAVRLYSLHVPTGHEQLVREILVLLETMNRRVLDFLVDKRKFTLQDVSYLLDELSLWADECFLKIKMLHSQISEEDFFHEVFAISLEVKDGISLLKSELVFLSDVREAS